MSSILKVDQLQDSGGNAIITSDGSGNLTAGTIPAKTIGTGAIIQVVNDSDSTNTVVSSSTYADTGLTASITPSSTSNKILIIISQDFAIENTNTSSPSVLGGFKLLRDATTLYTGSDDGNSFGVRYYRDGSNANRGMNGVWNYTFFDTPSSTSALVYKTQCRTYNTNSRWRLNNQINGISKSFITLMEIAG